MQSISAPVGEGCTNNPADVALVQAILLKTRRPGASPYLTAYDGVYGKGTKDAIQAFQTEHVFISDERRQSVPNPAATQTVVRAGDATWQKLVSKVDVAFSDLRILAGSRTVYVAATAQQLSARVNEVATFTFAPVFRQKVIACIRLMHEQFGIAIGVCPQGDRRTFQAQYLLLTTGAGVTHAGPGESNHNFGMAVDLGFGNLRWLKPHGEVTEDETPWLHKLEAKQNGSAEALKFWNALRTVGTGPAVGAFRGPESDRPHLQNWNDVGVDMAARLADLLTRSGTMRWKGAHQIYQCDLGYYGNFYTVGSARQIWNRQAAVTISMLTSARPAPVAVAGQRPGIGIPQAAQAGRLPAPGGAPRGPAPAPPVTQADVTAMQQALRREFELADAKWQNWTPF